MQKKSLWFWCRISGFWCDADHSPQGWAAESVTHAATVPNGRRFRYSTVHLQLGRSCCGLSELEESSRGVDVEHGGKRCTNQGESPDSAGSCHLCRPAGAFPLVCTLSLGSRPGP